MNNYWNRFLYIEKRLRDFSTHVDFDSRNYNTFSIEIMNLYLSTCSEIEAIYKACANKLNADNFNFRDFRVYYSNSLHEKSLKLLKTNIRIKYTSLTFNPFENIENLDLSLKWWQDHNKIKHNREVNIHLANLGNLLNAASALFILNLVYRFINQNKILIFPIPELFDAEGFLISMHSTGGGFLYTHTDCISMFTHETPYSD